MTDLDESTVSADPVSRVVHDTVLAVALAEPDEATARWSSLSGILDLDTCWDAEVLRLLGAVHASLVARENPETPRDAERLRGVYQRNWYAAQRCRHDVEQMRTALSDAGVASRVVGGVAWCDVAGIAPGERMVDDTTLVVAPRDLATATGVARTLGWQLSGQWRERPSRFARPRVLHRPLDDARPDAGRSWLRLAVSPHASAPVPRDGRGDGFVDDSDAALVEQVLVAVLGGPASPPDSSIGCTFDLVRFVRHCDADLSDVVRLASAWAVTDQVRRRLVEVMASHPSDRVAQLLGMFGAGGRPSAASPSADRRVERLAREWRAVTRRDPWWAAVGSVPAFVTERLVVDSAAQIPRALVRRLREHG